VHGGDYARPVCTASYRHPVLIGGGYFIIKAFQVMAVQTATSSERESPNKNRLSDLFYSRLRYGPEQFRQTNVQVIACRLGPAVRLTARPS